MNNFVSKSTVVRTFLGAAAILSAFAAQPAAGQVYPERAAPVIQFSIDLAEDMNKFVEPRVPVGTEPLRGSFFLTEGNIYPAGTIPTTGGDQFDPNSPGSVGTWFCKGTFLVPGSQFDKAAMAVLTDQLLLFNNGGRSIATTGTEGNGTVTRAVIGGTGIFAGFAGQQKQEFLGFNKTGGVNLRVTITLVRTANQ